METSKYRKATKTDLEDETKCDILMKMVTKDIRQHLVLNDMQGDYVKVRDLIEHIITQEESQAHSKQISSFEFCSSLKQSFS